MNNEELERRIALLTAENEELRQKLCDGAILKKAGISQLKEELNDLFDAEIGYMPCNFKDNGK